MLPPPGLTIILTGLSHSRLAADSTTLLASFAMLQVTSVFSFPCINMVILAIFTKVVQTSFFQVRANLYLRAISCFATVVAFHLLCIISYLVMLYLFEPFSCSEICSFRKSKCKCNTLFKLKCYCL